VTAPTKRRPRGAAPTTGQASKHRDEDPVTDLSRLTKLVKEVVAPTTLATALLFYFGWSHAYWFFDYFGVNSTVLGLTPSDYLMRGLDGLFVPLVVAALLGLVALWLRAVLAGRLGGRTLPTWLPVALGGAGVLLCANGLSRVLVVTAVNRPLAVAPVSLAAGIVSLTVAVRLATAAQPRSEVLGLVEYGVVFLLVGLSLFWAAADYSAAVGRSRAAQFVRELPSHPEAIVYSEHSLNMNARGVGVVSCRDPAAAYGYRYDGLALVLQSDDQYVLLSNDWSPGDGVAMVLPRNDSVRLEFKRASATDVASPC
jgi:hypothetical protein